MKFWCASGILNCFLYTGLMYFKWILWVKYFALPRSILLMLIAAWCLYNMSMYRCLNSAGTLRLAFCAVSFLGITYVVCCTIVNDYLAVFVIVQINPSRHP